MVHLCVVRPAAMAGVRCRYRGFLSEVEIPVAPHGFQHVSAARGPRIWARVTSALEEHHWMEELLQIEQELIARSGDCLAEKGSVR